MAKNRQTRKPDGLSLRARQLIERDPDAMTEVVMHFMVDPKFRREVTGRSVSRRAASTGAFETKSAGKGLPLVERKVARALKREGRSERKSEGVARIDGIPVSAPAPIPERLRRFVVPAEDDGGMVNATEAARRLGVARGTIYAWAEQGVLLAWRQTGPGLFIPAEQIRGPRDVVPGLPELAEIIPDPRLLWAFLDRAQPFEHGVRRPIELLAEERVDEVIGAARSYGASPS
jgi:excisionase family DNA binding protein